MKQADMYNLPDTCTPNRISFSRVGLLSDQEGVPARGLGAFDGTQAIDTNLYSPENNSVCGE